MNKYPNLIPPGHPLNATSQPPGKPNPKRDSARGHLVSTLAVIIAAPILALLMVAYIFQIYEVDGQSMEPTLHNNDRLVVLKTPKTWAGITGSQYVPGRGDIVVFNQTSHENSYGERQLIKRVIGLPGDRVVISNGKVRVYNNAHPKGYLVDEYEPWSDIVSDTPGNVDLQVPDYEVFVLGDNRGNSFDSPDFGTVPAEQIVGKLALRFFPFNQAHSF